MPSQPAAVTQTVERPVRRRRGGSAVEKAISDAVIAELAEVGFGRLTFEGVAERAGTGKSPLYRESGSEMHSMFDERLWLAWLVKARIIILTLLLGIELAIARLTLSPLPVKLFITSILLWYAFALFYLVLLSFWEEAG